jgi:hypothetical protein
MAKDEVQYGDHPDLHSPASKHLIEVITGTPHDQRRTNILLDKTAPTGFETAATDPHLQPDHNLEMIDDSPLPFTAAAALNDSPLPFNATAAKATAKHVQKPEEVLKHELLLMDITTNIHKPAVSETIALQGGHPTLGLVPEQHPEYTNTVTLTHCDPGTIAHKQIQ